jgi:hypothetical protein
MCEINKGIITGEAQQISDGRGVEGRTRPTPLTLHYIVHYIFPVQGMAALRVARG